MYSESKCKENEDYKDSMESKLNGRIPNSDSKEDNTELRLSRDNKEDDEFNSHGFRINYMNIKDARSNRKLWSGTASEWGIKIFDDEIEEEIPKEVLNCKQVSREINFSSDKQLDDFWMEQNVLLHGNCIETWTFHFGFVIAGSTNTWQQFIEAATKDEMIPPEILSGNVVFQTIFYNGNNVLCTSRFRMYYI